MRNTHITLNELFKSGKIYWVKSFVTLKRYLELDREHNNILQSKYIEASNGPTGKRYFIPKDRIDIYINAWEDDTLYERKITKS